MATQIDIKQGAPLLLALQFSNDDGSPANLTGYTVTSQVRDAMGNLVATLPMTVAAPSTGQYSITVPNTTAWPIAVLRCDIKATSGGQSTYSDTFTIRVGQAVTQ